MSFSSLSFALFVTVLLLGVGLARHETFRRALLLVASYVFYAWWDPRFLPLLVGFTVVTYAVGNAVANARGLPAGRRALVAGVSLSLGVLALFKYTNFILQTIAPLLDALGLHPARWTVPLPIGVSFFTFQAISYVVDIHRGTHAPARTLWEFALFKAFFPQLVAGPIVRAAELLPQLAERRLDVTAANLNRGACIFLVGLVKKVLVADRLALFVDPVFAHPGLFDAPTTLAAVVAYSLQIFCDFSGYSDMAIGIAKAFNIDLPKNFDLPYLAVNITDFWRRWHISLSSWLRDYLYIPLGGNRHGKVRTYVNLAATMLLGGLWHGASWNFVVWGALHGGALALHKAMGGRADGARSLPVRLISTVATYVFVCFAWIFFRAQTFGGAFMILKTLAHPTALGLRWIYEPFWPCAAAMLIWHLLRQRRGEHLELPLTSFGGWLVVWGTALLLWFGAPLASQPFIYFQF